MFEYLCFEENSFSALLSRTIRLDYSDNHLLYKYTDLAGGEKEGSYEGDAKTIVGEIEKLHIENWENEYRPEKSVLDGYSWGLHYKQKGTKTKNITGDNDYPEDYEKLVSILYKIVGIQDDVV